MIIDPASRGQVEKVKSLMKNASLRQITKIKDGQTALVSAASRGHLRVCAVILSRFAKEQVRHPVMPPDGRLCYGPVTPLMWASIQGLRPFVKLLLQHVPEEQVVMITRKGYSALMMASEEGHHEIVELLLVVLPEEQIRSRMPNGCTPLMVAAEMGHLETVKILLQHLPEEQVLAAESDGYTALLAASQNGHLEIVEYLLRYLPEEQIRLRLRDGCTPLMIAAEKGHLETVKILLQHLPEEQVLAAQTDGHTALLWASQNGHLEIVEYLLRYLPEEQVIARNDRGVSALMMIAMMNDDCEDHTRIAKLLLMHCPEDHVLFSFTGGETPLMYACENGNLQLIEALLRHLPEDQLRATRHDGITALYIMLSSDLHRVAGARILLEHIPEEQVMLVVATRADKLSEIISNDVLLALMVLDHSRDEDAAPLLNGDVLELLLSNYYQTPSERLRCLVLRCLRISVFGC